jgi:hypothetical protein
MRFLPTGFGSGDAGTLGDSESEEEMLHGTAGLGMPNGLNLPSRKREKRKHTEVNDDARSGSSKKHKTVEDVQRKEERRAKKEKRRAQEAALAKS